MKKIFLSLILIIYSSINIYAQCSTFIEYQTKVELAEVIFEGTVIKKESFWSDDQRQILTANYIEVKANHKSTTPKVVKLITKGGKIDDLVCVVEPSLKLEEGASGCFFTRFRLDDRDWFIPFWGSQSLIHSSTYHQLPEDFPINLKLKYLLLKEGSNFNSKSPPISITSISPMEVAGGIGQVMTIQGSGFGTFAPPAKVQFRNPNFFEPTISYQTADENHIISWTDTEIQLTVPGKDLANGKAGAGSGEIRVVNAAGDILQSAQNITVIYNKINHDFVEVDLVNDNGNGAYTFQFGSDFFNNIPAKETFVRALNKWTCGTQSNFQVNEANATSSACVAQDGINAVSFDNDCNLPFGTLAETTQWFSFCGNGVTFFEEIDIVFSTGINWNYGNGPTGNFEKDFESIVLHELGHAHGVEHVLNQETTMYPSLADGVELRSIDQQTKTCANLIIDHSSQAINCGNQSPFIPTDICEFNLELKIFLEGPYLNNGLMNTSLVENNLLPNTPPYNESPYNFDGIVTNNNLPTNAVDWVLVEARTGTANLAPPKGTFTEETQIGLLLENGNVVNSDGTSPLQFRNLATGEPYYFAIRHRNHLDIISANTVIAANNMTYDFTTNVTQALGQQQQILSDDGKAMMLAGDFTQDNIIQISDYDMWFTEPAAVNVYETPDANLDAVIQVTDYDAWFPNRAKIGNIELNF